jgi:hypothetical protein
MARALDTGPNQSGGERLTLATGYDKNRAIRAMFRKGGPDTPLSCFGKWDRTRLSGPNQAHRWG